MRIRQHIKLITFIALLLFLQPGKAQSTMGKDFWVTFLPNYEHAHVSWNFSHVTNTLELIVVGKRPCSGRVVNPNTQWSTTFEVQPGMPTIVSIPTEGNYQDEATSFEEDSDCILNQGLHVVATDSISLYSTNTCYRGSESACILPTHSLGDEYIIQTFPAIQLNDFDFSEFCIIATQNNTVVDINLTDKSAHGHQANTPFSVTLHAGQCYQVLSASSYVTQRDFSGTHIKARNGKRIAVFAGNNYARIFPEQLMSTNYLSEQLMPVDAWGKRFIIISPQGSRRNMVRVTALNNNCKIKRDGVLVATIQAMETFEYEIASSTTTQILETSEPAQVILYFTNHYKEVGGEVDGWAAMVVIPPLVQRIKDITFSTANISSGRYKHYVIIVTRNNDVPTMRLDGNSISSQFHPVPHSGNYYYARIEIQYGCHTLSNSGGGFVAYICGLGNNGNGANYAYSTGNMVVSQTTAQIMVDHQYSSGFSNGFWFCEDDTVHFSLFTNYDVSRAEWRFGDNTTGTGAEIAHHYSQTADYTVSCDVYKLSIQGQDSLMGTLTTKIHIQQPTEQDVFDSDCDSHDWHGNTYLESGVYTYQGQSLGGCDSIVNLHLTIHPTVIVPYDTVVCDQFEWYDSVYLQSGVYSHLEGKTDFGCDRIAEMHLTIEHASPISIDGPLQVFAATNLVSGIYLYQVSDSLNIDPNTLEWVCSNPDWIVEPLDNGYSCHLIVTTTGPGTLGVITHNTTGCNTSSSIEINATYYDIDDNEPLEVVLFPNPAQTKVSLKAPQLQLVRIFNSMGQYMKEIDVKHTDAISIDIADLKPGVYFVEITTSFGKTVKHLSVF